MLMPNSQRSKDDRDAGYRVMHLLGEELLRNDRDVVFDATYGAREHRRAVEALVTTLAVPLYLIEFHVSPDAAVARFKGRTGHLASDLTEERVRKIAQLYCYSGCGLAVTKEVEPFSLLEQVNGYLRAGSNVVIDGRWSNSANGYSV
jgi:predicted kinase